MKKFIFTTAFALITSLGFSQSKYETAMKEKMAKVEQHLSVDDFQKLSNDFTRIADAEKTQWQPYYFASFAQIQKGRILMQQNKTAELDAVAAEAQKPLDKAMELSKDNAELYILKK